MSSSYDDEIWSLVPDGAPAPAHLAAFVGGLEPVASCLDLGCGDGRLTTFLRAERLTVADVSRVALARVGERLPAADTVQLQVDRPLPLHDNAFDLVLCAETLEHVRDVALLLSEARRVLRPGGSLAVTTPAHGRLTGLDVLLRGFGRRFDPLSPDLRFFCRRSLAGLLDALGFDVASMRRDAGTLLAVATR